MDEGYLFIYNISTGTISYSSNIISSIDYANYDHAWKDASLEVGKDGYVYGTAGGKLFKVNPSTKAVTIILSSGASGLTQDEYGNMYYKNGPTLYRYSF
jgi:hypothetical protein